MIFILFFQLICIFGLQVSNRADGLNETKQVVVRAVFINCDAYDETNDSASEVTRFHREELFKHNALRECQKKLALTLKITSDAEVKFNGEEYIPIEHVFDGPNRKRVRLLDPYILRIRRELPLQAYKLRLIDTISGSVADSNYARSNKIKKNRVDRNVVELHENSVLKKTSIPLANNMNYSAKYSVCPANSNVRNREKRHEHNIIVEEATVDDIRLPWVDKNYIYHKHPHDAELDEIEDSSILLEDSDKYERTESTNLDAEKTKHRYNLKSLHHSSPIKSYNNPTKSFEDNVVKSTKVFTKLHDHKTHKSTTHSHKTHKSTTHAHHDVNQDSEEKGFSIYKIGKPILWYTVHLQLFEKMSSPEGNTVWNDITKGEIASVSSTDPEWMTKDLNIKYKPTDWIPNQQFELSGDTTWCLLVPFQNGAHRRVGDDKSSKNYIVVPMNDIDNMFSNDSTIKRNENDSLESESLLDNQEPRRILIRASRAIFGRDNDLKISLHGHERYLTLPHRRSHRAQIDLEARADDNELIRVGSSGSITTLVADSSRLTRSVITIQAMNKGLAAARFRIRTRDCGPEISKFIEKNNEEADSVLIPPRHTYRFQIEIPFEIPVDSMKCTMAMINDEEETVAVRDVTIKKGDRCFCVWHCDCVCLDDDPKLICRDMAEPRQEAAGLAPRERRRRARSACYSDVVSVDLIVIIFGVLLFLMLLGFIKAILGLIIKCIGEYGLDRIIQKPRKLERYYESHLKCRPVEYDDQGWPVHPDTKQRTVALVSKPMEFMLNVIFFITLPSMVILDTLKHLLCQIKQSTNVMKGTKQSYEESKCGQDLQNAPKRSLRRRRPVQRWMTPRAEMLSADIWNKNEFMRPLLHESLHKTGEVSSCVDSELDDTEYVHTQMQKSKESLIRRQQKIDVPQNNYNLNSENVTQ